MKRFNPTSKSRRHMTVISYRQLLSGDSPHKPLVRGVQRSVGRNSAGRLTTRHKGGGHKRLFREIDFRFEKRDIPAAIETIEYDPNRSAFIALVCYKDGERRYIVIPKGMRVGDSFVVSEKAEVKIGNRLPLLRVPVGAFVYNIEIKPGGGAVLARSAGNYAEVVAVEGGYVNIKLPSSEVRKVSDRCWATVGEVSNEENHLVNIGKAGRSRWLGIRPTVRGSVMNPVDHPYGGGEGKQGRGTRRAKSKWGKPTGKGQKSRRPKKYSNYLVVSRRKVGKR
ncbi:MAG: 50S ribosomal protein L2 [Candidatus Taylorbacteria bacterium RIFCSPLOWO2_12_FULL_47_20]|uniref:Large ribosomal subunit protein uL2 n=2 Tax=Candidatus Tayloriibacteriota TaxID=1817919 RepID=A0A1G2P724_9BACT|nr:MAG: 50S ribosomal protein L2 [Candidatus Taylorbacteria bacterium RIFCSPLOWO2_02_FULL_46_40]OHA44073.1 MAG: 50S ribosomal protein L2 [Candidatus Taylorbacteria bacterium RIFCSPLOWO2_12_FULL_47_20]